MTGKELVESLRFVEVLNNGRVSVNTKELVEAIDAAIQAEREWHLKYLVMAYDVLGRRGWEEGLNDVEVRDRIFDHLCNCDCDPNLSEKAQAIRARKETP